MPSKQFESRLFSRQLC